MKLVGKTVNSIKEFKNTVNSNTVNGITNKDFESTTLEEKISKVIEENSIKPEAIGEMVANGLGDQKSLRLWTLIAENDPEKLLDAYHQTKNANTVRFPPAYCISILKAMGVRVKFKKGGELRER